MSESLQRPGVHPVTAAAADVIGRSADLASFRLGGGTALAWHLGHRVSFDLDFFSFTPGILSPERRVLLEATIRSMDAAAEFSIGERTLHGRVAGCQVSFFELDAAWIDPPTLVSDGLSLASVRELAAMKLVAVMTRCAKKDFYDIAAIAESGFAVDEMVDAGRAMFSGFDAAIDHLRRSLVYFDEAETDPDPVTLVKTTWPAVKRAMQLLARRLTG